MKRHTKSPIAKKLASVFVAAAMVLSVAVAPSYSAAAASGDTTFTDDFSAAPSGNNFVARTGSPSDGSGDIIIDTVSTDNYKGSGYAARLVDGGSLEYQMSQPITGFTMSDVYFQSAYFYTVTVTGSSDGVAYVPIDVTETQTGSWWGDNFDYFSYTPSGAIPDGITYLKFSFSYNGTDWWFNDPGFYAKVVGVSITTPGSGDTGGGEPGGSEPVFDGGTYAMKMAGTGSSDAYNIYIPQTAVANYATVGMWVKGQGSFTVGMGAWGSSGAAGSVAASVDSDDWQYKEFQFDVAYSGEDGNVYVKDDQGGGTVYFDNVTYKVDGGAVSLFQCGTCDYEWSGNFPGYNSGGSGQWTDSGNTNVFSLIAQSEINGSGGGSAYTYAPGLDGDYALQYTYNSDGTNSGNGYNDLIMQNISGLTDGEAYTLYFSYKPVDPANAGMLQARVQKDWDNNAASYAPAAGWSAFAYPFTAGGNNQIAIGGGDALVKNGQSIYIDNIVVVDADGSVVSGCLTNPSFENGDLTGWSSLTNDHGAFAVVDLNAPPPSPPSGNHVFHFYKPEGNNGWSTTATQDNVSLAAGTYTMTADVYGTGNAEIRILDGGYGETGAPLAISKDGSDGWTTVTVTFDVTSAMDNAHVQIMGTDGWYETDLLIDNIVLAQSGVANAVANGDFEDGMNGWYPAPNGDGTVLEVIPDPTVKQPPSEGNHVLHFYKPEGNNGWYTSATQDNISLEPGTYTMYVDVYGTGNAEIRLMDGGYGDIGTPLPISKDGTDGWTTVTAAFDVTSAMANAHVQIMGTDGWNETDLLIDNIVLAQAGGANAVTNGDFEDGMNGWYFAPNGDGTVLEVIPDPTAPVPSEWPNQHTPGGKYAAKLTTTQPDGQQNWNDDVFNSSVFTLAAGNTYTVSFWAKASGEGVGTAARFAAASGPGDDIWLGEIARMSGASNGPWQAGDWAAETWIQYTQEYTATASGEYSLEFLVNDNWSAPQTLYIDDVSVTGSTGELIKNGTFEGATRDTDWSIGDSRFSIVDVSDTQGPPATVLKIQPSSGYSYLWNTGIVEDGTYRVTMSVKGDAVVNTALIDTTTWGDFGVVTPVTGTGSDWADVSFSVPMSGLDGKGISLRFQNPDSGVLYIQSVKIEENIGGVWTTVLSTILDDSVSKYTEGDSSKFTIIPRAEADAWTRPDTGDATEGYTHSGEWAMVREPSDQGYWDGPYQTVTLTAGVKYHVSGWFMTDPTQKTGQLNFRVVDSNWNAVASPSGGQVDVTGTSPDGWQLVDYYYTPDASGSYNVQIMQWWATDANTYIDDVSMYACDASGNDTGANLIQNGGFENGEANWSQDKLGSHNPSSSMFILKFKAPELTNAFIDNMSSHTGSAFTFGSGNMWYQQGVSDCFPQGDGNYRMMDGVSSGGSVPGGYGWLQYQTSYDINEFMVTTYYWSDQKPTALRILLSKDGNDWVDVSDQTGAYQLGGNATQWPRLVYEWSGTDAGYRFLRIEQPDNPDMYNWALLYRQVAVNAYCSPVSADVPSMTKIPDTGMDVSLSSPETDNGAVIMYSLNGGTPAEYAGPIHLTDPTLVEAYTTMPGGTKADSIHLKFTYPSAANESIDAWGQVIHKDTATPEHPQLVHSDAELAYVFSPGSAEYPDGLTKADYWSNMNQVANDMLNGANGSTDVERDQYGGLAGSEAEIAANTGKDTVATGYYHIEYVTVPADASDADAGTATKTVMVDPAGNMFFSLGVDGIGTAGDTYTLTTDREYIYQWLPDQHSWADMLTYGPAYGDANHQRFSFYVANRIKNLNENNDPTEINLNSDPAATFGNFDTTAFYDESVARLKDWGFNTAGGFSGSSADEPDFARVDFMNGWGGSIPGYDNKVFDVFNQGNYDAVVAGAKAVAIANQNSTNIIGFMLANELPYDQVCYAIGQQKASACDSKQKMVDMLQAEYGTIAAFNAAWGKSYASWTDVAEGALTTTNAQSNTDMNAFLLAYAERYYAAYRQGWDEGGGKQMLIGDRWLVSIMSDNLGKILGQAAGEYLDCITYNYYAESVDLNKLQSIFDASKTARNNYDGIPLIITEFHYGDGSTDQAFGVSPAADTTEKGLKYSAYVQTMAASGFVVGTHWFEYLDEASTGRWFDGENGAIGLINVADRPYVDIFGPSTEADLTNPGLTNPGVLYTNYNIYKYMNDELTPIEAPNATNEEHEHNKTANFVKVPDGQAIDVAAGTSPGAGYVGSPLVITYADCVLGGTGMPGYGAQVYPAWDDSNLYLYVHVDDPTPGNNANSGAGIWNGDGLEVFIGPNQDELDVNTGFLADDVQIMLNGVYVNGKVDFYVRGANGQVDIPLDMALSYDASGKGYVVEVSIPWSGLGIANPVNGQQMRFDIGFDNANPSGAVGGGASGRDRQYLWTGYDKNSSDRMYWGTITLTDSVDKTALQAAVDDAQALVEADYTAASWADFAGALADAEAVLADDGATQAEVDAALAALNAAVAGLVEAAADVTLTGIAVETQPKLTYTETDKLDLSLLSVTLSYSDGSTQTVPYADFAADGGFALAYPNGDAAAQGDVMTAAYNGLTIAITYGDFTANTGALSVTVNAAYDVNGDGKVDSADLALIMANLNKKAATNAVTKKCDVDGSGMVDMNDYALVAAYIAAVAAAAP